MVPDQFGRRSRDQETDFRTDAGGKGLAQQVGDEARRALDRLQRDIARKSVAHDHVAFTAVDLVGFDIAFEFHRQPGGGAQRFGGGLDVFGALGFLGPDVEQAGPRAFAAGDDPRIGRAHDCELDEVAGIAFAIRAQIEHDHVIVGQRREQCGQRRTVEPGHGAQRKLAHRHQRAGIARGNRGAGIALLHCIDRKAHAGGLGTAQRAARQLVAADHVGAMQYFGRPGHAGMRVECSLDARFIANQQELELVVTPTRQRGAFDHHAHAFVSAHRIDGDTRQAHGASPAWLTVLKTDGDDFAAVIISAVRAQIVRALEFAAVRALMMGLDLERIMCTAIAAAVGRYFPLGDGHGGTCSSNNYSQFRWPP